MAKVCGQKPVWPFLGVLSAELEVGPLGLGSRVLLRLWVNDAVGSISGMPDVSYLLGDLRGPYGRL